MKFTYKGQRENGHHVFESVLIIGSWKIISPFRAEHSREVDAWFSQNFPTAKRHFEFDSSTNLLVIEDDQIAVTFKLAWL